MGVCECTMSCAFLFRLALTCTAARYVLPGWHCKFGNRGHIVDNL